MAYRVLAWFLRLVTRVFFRQIEVVGTENIPAGPVLFAGNHPNSLIDPILIITTCGRKVHFAAKDSLFKGRLMRAVLGGLGAVPVARKSDVDGPGAATAVAPTTREAGELAKVNDAAFEHMFDVLGRGDAIGIFPEGISHDASQLSKLKTGAARIALGAAARSGQPVTIVPCGLTFIHPKRFRSRVLVQYGLPIVIAPSAEPDVPATTAAIDSALRRLTINAPDWATVRALDTVRRLYQPPGISIEERVELARRFNTHYAALAEDPRVIAILARARSYRDRLDELGISDRELAQDLPATAVGARMARHVALVAFWLPLCLPGLPLHLPTVVFARIAGPRLTPRKDVIATTKMLVGMLLCLLSYAVAVGLVGAKLGAWWAVAAAVILPASGWATLRVLDRIAHVQRAFGVLARRLRFRHEVTTLRAERAVLVDDVVRTVAEVKPVGLTALFPPDHPERLAHD